MTNEIAGDYNLLWVCRVVVRSHMSEIGAKNPGDCSLCDRNICKPVAPNESEHKSRIEAGVEEESQ
jgi:hypothetical protein